MDPGFFADPDPGFKSPDPSINKLLAGILMMVLIRFWRSLAKKDSVKSARF